MQVGSSLNSFDLGRMTDLALALYQDSGWYDVKYGSAGVSTHGYHAGCAWGMANEAGILNDPATDRLLCQPEIVQQCDLDSCITPLLSLPISEISYVSCLEDKAPACSRCTGDYAAIGMCRTTRLDNGLVFPKPVPDFNQAQGLYNMSTRKGQYSKDCTLTAFSRCVDPASASSGLPRCANMSCTAQGQLLIDDAPCDPSASSRLQGRC